jgi:hypothetical protein
VASCSHMSSCHPSCRATAPGPPFSQVLVAYWAWLLSKDPELSLGEWEAFKLWRWPGSRVPLNSASCSLHHMLSGCLDENQGRPAKGTVLTSFPRVTQRKCQPSGTPQSSATFCLPP